MQEVQLAKDKPCIKRIPRVRAHIHDVEALVNQVSHRYQLLQDQARGIVGLGQSQSGAGSTTWRGQRVEAKLNILDNGEN